MSPAALAHLAAPISSGPGPGLFLRLIVIGSIVGVLALVWILARANSNN
ncbi:MULTISPECIES: hypothetical protein [Kitasatospora]|nr:MULTISPECIES: hypothetical protein [Kitasatospora]MDH6138728.1 hypothetical protein [Kitasatospora sp. GP30]